MINGYYFQKMHINEKGTFAAEVADATAPFAATMPALAAYKKTVDDRLAIYRKSLEKLSMVDLSSLIESDDDHRDNGLTNLRDYAQLCTERKNAAWAQAGQLIVNTYRKIGWDMDRMAYADETTRVDTLLSMLKNEPELRQAVETIQAQEWVTEIEEAQASFKQHSTARVDKTAAQEAKSNTVQAAKELGEAIAKEFRFIESEIEFYNKAELKDLVFKLNTIIAKYVTLQKQRATRSENDQNATTK